MMRVEFIKLTGFEPTQEEYSQIEARYMSDPNVSKEEFCKKFIADGEDRKLCAARAALIDLLRDRNQEQDRRHAREIASLEETVKKLKTALEAEEEWKPVTDCGTQLSEDEYQHLLKSGICETLTVDAAKDLVYQFCGFDREQVQLVEAVYTYEMNRHRKLRKANCYCREPVYASTDWNYVRFNCKGFQYELINGELRFYES